MAASLRLKSSQLRLNPLFQLQRLNHTSVEGGLEVELVADPSRKTKVTSGNFDKKWKMLDSRSLGITCSMIPDSSRIILKILQNKGHDSYLVGGCVRDLLLNRAPKDFDVITTANLQEIRRHFDRAIIIGKRFPICKVLLKGSAIEVASFNTVAKDTLEKGHPHLSKKVPNGYGKKDLMLWKNALRRDFTINSLFYDPLAHKIYDYASGMEDLASMKLRTLVPAHLSFKEDCARILRGLRIAARLRLSFAKDTEKATHNLYASVKNLDKSRLMMEMNYMLSYGAAKPSLLLLERFNLLQLLLPFHAAHLNNHSGAQTPRMLVKLFFNLDRIVSCDKPCDSALWVSLLAFHLALVNNPHSALVVRTFSAVLYHGNWNKGVYAGRQLLEAHVNIPEILEPCGDVSDDVLARMVANFASMVMDSVDALTDSKSLLKAMSRYPSSPCSGLVFISKNAGNEVVEIFKVLVGDITLLNSNARNSSNIDYKLLGKGNKTETRFVIGKVIMDTMNELAKEGKQAEQGELGNPHSVDSELETPKSKDSVKQGLLVVNDELQRKPKKRKNKMPSPSDQKLVKESVCTSKDIWKKKQHLIGVVKDVKELLSLGNPHSVDSELETPKSKNSVKQGLLVVNDQLQRKPKKHKNKKPSPSDQKLVKENVCTILRSKDIWKKKQQLISGVVKDAKELLSVRREHHEVLAQAPKMAMEFIAQDTKDVLNTQKNALKVKQPKAEASTEILKMSRRSNVFEGEKERVKKEVTPEKEQTKDEKPPQKIHKLSGLFK